MKLTTLPLGPAEKARILGNFVAYGFRAAVIYHFLLVHGAGYVGDQYSTFLVRSSDRFQDFMNLRDASRGGDPYAYAGSVYFPFAFLVMKPFFLPPGRFGLCPYLVITGWTLWRYLAVILRRTAPTARPSLTAAVIVVLSYPALFAFDRGNFELLILALLVGFMGAFRERQWLLSALFLGAASAIKGYPILYILLYLADRRYLYALVAVSTAAALTLLATLWLPGGVAGSFLQLQSNLLWFHHTYIVAWSSLAFNTGLYGMVRILAAPFVPGLVPVDPSVTVRWFQAYSLFASAAQVGLVAWVLCGEKELWKRAFLIAASFILLPPVTFDYKLLHLLLPLGLFFESSARTRLDRAYAVIFGLLLVPKAYVVLSSAQNPAISVTSILTPLLMLAFLTCLACDQSRFMGHSAPMTTD